MVVRQEENVRVRKSLGVGIFYIFTVYEAGLNVSKVVQHGKRKHFNVFNS
jgi:hypothetical protein